MNDFSLTVIVENSTCVVDFDIVDDEIYWETLEVSFKTPNNEWVEVTDLLSDSTLKSIEEQIYEQWDEIIRQARERSENYE